MRSEPISADLKARRDFGLGVANGALFGLAETLTDPALVLVAFVAALGGSPLVVGLAAPIRNAGWYLPQLLVSGRVQSAPRKLPIYARVAVLRLAAWGVVALSPLLLGRLSPGAVLAVFLIAFFVAESAAGVAGLPFLEVVSKVIPASRRGEFFGWRLTLAGAAGIVAGWVVHGLLGGAIGLPLSYGAIFFLAFVTYVVGMVLFFPIHEPPDAHTVHGIALREQLRSARGLWGADSDLRRFLYLRLALIVTGAAVPFYTLFAQRELGLPIEEIGVYITVYTGASLVANLVLGRLTRQLGDRRIMRLSAWASLLMALIVIALALLAARAGPQWLNAGMIAVYMLLGLREAGIGIAGMSMLLGLAPDQQRSLYLGLANSVMGAGLLLSAVAGIIVEWAGSMTLFVVAALGSAAALLVVGRVREAHAVPAHEKG
jgi:predicted MFS family arabinose efflux permease